MKSERGDVVGDLLHGLQRRGGLKTSSGVQEIKSILIIPSLLDIDFHPHQGKPLVKAELFPHLESLGSA